MHEFYDIIIIDAVLRPVLYVNFSAADAVMAGYFCLKDKNRRSMHGRKEQGT